MFLSDLYMSTWPIKFIGGLESFSFFINLSLWPPSRSGKGGGRNERERGCAHWKGGSGWKREAPFSELLPIFSLPWDQLGSATERVPVNA